MNKIITHIAPNGPRGHTIENARRLREERKINLAMTGEMALCKFYNSNILRFYSFK